MQKINDWYLKDNETSLTFLQTAQIHKLTSTSWQHYLIKYLAANFFVEKSMNVCIDVGASYGFFTNAASKYFNNVYSFELQPDVWECLCLNTNYTDRIKTYNIALGSSDGFSSWDNSITNSGRVKSIDSSNGVKRTTLDSFNLAPDLLKIDVEGAELEVLLGSKNTLTKYNPVIIIEIFNNPKDKKTDDKHRLQVFDFLNSLGYNCADCRGQDFVFVKR